MGHFETDDEIIISFQEESLEHLADIEADLLEMEKNGSNIDEELVNKVFRAAHTIKGCAGFVGLEKVKELAHKVENVLGMMRNKEIIPDSENINILLLGFDFLREMVTNVAESENVDISEQVVALTGIALANLPDANKEEAIKTVMVYCPESHVTFEVTEMDICHARKPEETVYLIEYDLIHDVHSKGKTPIAFLKELNDFGILIDCKVVIEQVGLLDDDEITNKLPLYVLIASEIGRKNICQKLSVKKECVYCLAEDGVVLPLDWDEYEIVTPPAEVEEPGAVELETKVSEPANTTSEQPSESADRVDTQEQVHHKAAPEIKEKASRKTSKQEKDKTKSTAAANATVRVNVGLLDQLMTLAGELVLSRNGLIQANQNEDRIHLSTSVQRINHVTSELQEAIMLTRMQPVGHVFNKYPRIVRDLSMQLGKEIELTISGNEVELDKTILEGVGDPLTHLIRNSVDHGIEMPSERKKAGKSTVGHISLRAYHEAGQVNIEITDDGKGIDADKIASSAVSKGLITQQAVDEMSEKDKTALIFLPGFSTAEKVTDVSGRGVGMDVVKTNLDNLGGLVEIDTAIGKGTSICINLPLTLAIRPSLMVACCNHRYAIPMTNVVELLRIPAHQISEKIETVSGAQVVRLRQELLPIIYLKEVIGDAEGNCADKSSKQPGSRALNIVVVNSGSIKYGLVVDKFFDSEEIVVKPLDSELRECGGYAGATILGDGQVALILDIVGIAKLAELDFEAFNEDVSDRIGLASETEESLRLLCFCCSSDEYFGVPVDLVERIEHIRASNIETFGGMKVIKYRGGILPLKALDEEVNVKPLAQKEKLIVIVFNINNKEVGLLATSPLNITNTTGEIDCSTLAQNGIKGSTIIDDRNVQIVDIFKIFKVEKRSSAGGAAFVSSAAAEFESEDMSEAKNAGDTILYAEDSTFFRNNIKSIIEGEGYKVIDARDGLEALQLLNENSDKIGLVVTDVEMPNMDGLTLTQRIRDDSRFKELPIIALTTLADNHDIQRGMAAGVTEYQTKVDEGKLLNSIGKYMCCVGV